jgi:hypothetical protein
MSTPLDPPAERSATLLRLRAFVGRETGVPGLAA